MRGRYPGTALLLSGIMGCVHPNPTPLHPLGNLAGLKAEAKKDGAGWSIVLSLPNSEATHGWQVVPQGEPLDIQLFHSNAHRAQWHVTEARWASNRPFKVRISADEVDPVEVQLSYQSNPLHPAARVALEVLRMVTLP